MAERPLCMRKAQGSNPCSSTHTKTTPWRNGQRIRLRIWGLRVRVPSELLVVTRNFPSTGMPGAERIRDSVRLHPALEKHWRAMRPLAMICATPAVLGEPKGFLEGVAATSHPAFIDEIGGSLEETQPYTEGRVVWDANIITSRGPGTALEWSLCCVEAIFGRAKALEVAGPMVTQPATLPAKRPFEWRLEEEEVSSRVDRALEKYAN